MDIRMDPKFRKGTMILEIRSIRFGALETTMVSGTMLGLSTSLKNLVFSLNISLINDENEFNSLVINML